MARDTHRKFRKTKAGMVYSYGGFRTYVCRNEYCLEKNGVTRIFYNVRISEANVDERLCKRRISGRLREVLKPTKDFVYIDRRKANNRDGDLIHIEYYCLAGVDPCNEIAEMAECAILDELE